MKKLFILFAASFTAIALLLTLSACTPQESEVSNDAPAIQTEENTTDSPEQDEADDFSPQVQAPETLPEQPVRVDAAVDMASFYGLLPGLMASQHEVSYTPQSGAQKRLQQIMSESGDRDGKTSMTSFLESYPLPEDVVKQGISLEGITSFVAGGERMFTLEFRSAEPTETRLYGFSIESSLGIVSDMMEGLHSGASVEITPDADGQLEIEKLIDMGTESEVSVAKQMTIFEAKYASIWPEGWVATNAFTEHNPASSKFAVRLVYQP